MTFAVLKIFQESQVSRVLKPEHSNTENYHSKNLYFQNRCMLMHRHTVPKWSAEQIFSWPQCYFLACNFSEPEKLPRLTNQVLPAQQEGCCIAISTEEDNLKGHLTVTQVSQHVISLTIQKQFHFLFEGNILPKPFFPSY